MAETKERKLLSTTIKDSFFDDPFFKDWWNDFDDPFHSWQKKFSRQISGKTLSNPVW